jgi:hypothetical protein
VGRVWTCGRGQGGLDFLDRAPDDERRPGDQSDSGS